MKKIAILLSVCAAVGLWTIPASAQTAIVVSSCGTLTLAPGYSKPIYEDTTGAQCTTAAGGAGTSVSIVQTTPGTTNGVVTNSGSVTTAAQGAAAAVTAGWPTINGEPADTAGTFTNATQSGNVTSATVDGYETATISINGTYGTATATFLASDDAGTTFYPIACARSDGSAVEIGYTALTNTNRAWFCPIHGFDSVRILSSAVASGTVNVRISISSSPTAAAVAQTSNVSPASRTIVALDVSTVTTGGTAVTALTAGHKTAGGFLLNPIGATINLCINEQTTASGTTSAAGLTCILPGQSYSLTPSTGSVSVITSDSAHPFSGQGLQ